MVSIRELEKTDTKYIRTIAQLHKQAFPLFFLTQLGIPFLETLYAGYLEDNDSGIIVAEESNKIIGFIAYSNDYPRFYKVLIKKHLLRFAFYAFQFSVRHPVFIKRLLGAFKKSDSVVKEEKYVELASICVDPTIKGKGVGSALIDFFKDIVDFNLYEYINLETDADGNDEVNYFYQKNNFKLARTFTTTEGRKMNEYRYRGFG